MANRAELKRRLVEESGGRCQACGDELREDVLQLRRLDRPSKDEKALNFGYTANNVVLVCAACAERRSVTTS